MTVIKASNAPIVFDVIDNIVNKVTPEAVASLKRTGGGIKGEFTTGVGRGTLPSINIDLRRGMQVRAQGGAGSRVWLCAACSPSDELLQE